MYAPAQNTSMANPNTDTPPNERVAVALAAFFRSLSASSDRELAGAAFALEPKVLDLVRSKAETRPQRPAKNPG